MLTHLAALMRDAVSLPWPVVRSAWAVSMTDMEEGRLSWGIQCNGHSTGLAIRSSQCTTHSLWQDLALRSGFVDTSTKVLVQVRPIMELTNTSVVIVINKGILWYIQR